MRIRFRGILQAGVLLSALTFSAGAYARFYIGGGGGQATFQNTERVQQACTTVGATCSVDDNDTGYKLFAGYRLGQYLSFEGGYVDLGKAKATATVPVTATASLSGSGVFVALLPQIPLGPSGAIFGRIGLAAVDAKLSAASGGTSLSDSSGAASIVFGGGAEFRLTNNVSIRGEWERYAFDETLNLAGVKINAPDIDLLSASLVFSF